MIGRRCSDPAPGYFLPSLDYFLYEAELAAPLHQGSAPSSTTTSSLVCNTLSACDSQILCTNSISVLFILWYLYIFKMNTAVLPRCEQYFRDQGFDFKLSNGRVVVVRRTRRLTHQRRQVSISGGCFSHFILFIHWWFLWILQQNSIALNQGHALQIIPRQRTAGDPITWTGLGWVRVLEGSGLRFKVDNLLSSMEVQLVIRYETEVRRTISVKLLGKERRLIIA